MTRHETTLGVCVFCGKTHGIYTPCGVSNEQPMTKPNTVLTDEQDKFESVFPMPNSCTRILGGYAATDYNAWSAHSYKDKWEGWKAHAILAKQAAQVEPPFQWIADQIAELFKAKPEGPYSLTRWQLEQIRQAFKYTTEAQVEPVAVVPIHPRQGPLWANTVQFGNENVPQHYPLMNLYTTPPASSALVEAAGKVSNAWEIEGDYVTAMNTAVTELRAALEAEKKGQV